MLKRTHKTSAMLAWGTLGALFVAIGVGCTQQHSDGQATAASQAAEASAPAEASVASNVASDASNAAPASAPTAAVSASADAVPPPEKITYHGALITYPKGATEAQLTAADPGVKCMDYNGRACMSENGLSSVAFIQADPLVCIVGKELVLGLQNDRVNSAMCDITEDSATRIANSYTQRFGNPKVDRSDVASLRSQTATWIADGDSVALTHSTGNDVSGNAVDGWNIIISDVATASTDTTSSETQVAPRAFQTSFDCTKARSDSEKLICGDEELAADDVKLADIYAKAKAAVSDPAAFKEQTRQAWNERERNCHDKACLVDWYSAQTARLTSIVQVQPAASVADSNASAAASNASWWVLIPRDGRCEPVESFMGRIAHQGGITTPQDVYRVFKADSPMDDIAVEADQNASKVTDRTTGLSMALLKGDEAYCTRTAILMKQNGIY